MVLLPTLCWPLYLALLWMIHFLFVHSSVFRFMDLLKKVLASLYDAPWVFSALTYIKTIYVL